MEEKKPHHIGNKWHKPILLFSVAIAIIVATLQLDPTYAPNRYSGHVINVTNSVGSSVSHEVTTSERGAYLVWDDDTPGNFDIFFGTTNYKGTSIRDKINLSNNLGDSNSPQLAAYGPFVFVVWEDYTDGDGEVLFTRSTDRGARFSTTINLSNTPEKSLGPKIAVSGSNVYIAWQDHSFGNSDVLFRKSSDYGATFGPTVNLSKSIDVSTGYGFINIIASDNYVYLAWDAEIFGKELEPLTEPDAEGSRIIWNGEIFFRASSDYGATFGPVINLSNSEGRSTGHKIAVFGDDVYIVWYEESPYIISFRASHDNGATFGPVVALSDTAAVSHDPQVAVSNNNVYVVWVDNALGNSGLAFRASHNNGVTFDPVTVLADSGGSFGSKVIGVSASNVYVLWDGAFFRKSSDYGATFGPVMAVSDITVHPETSALGELIILDDNLYVLWDNAECLSDTCENKDIFFTAIDT